MTIWFAFTGQSLLRLQGSSITDIISSPGALAPLRVAAMAERQRLGAQAWQVPEGALFALLMARAAMQDIGAAPSPTPQVFRHVGEVLGVFEELDIVQTAADVANARTVCTAAMTAAETLDALLHGALLLLPRDTAQLHTRALQNHLPGVLAFLLEQELALRKAFSEYLRKGTTPTLSAAALAQLAMTRPVLRSFEREARIERELAAETAHE